MPVFARSACSGSKNVHSLITTFARRGVAGVGDDGNVDLARDLDVLRAEFAQFLLRQVAELVLELAPALEDGEAEARHRVTRGDGAHADVVLDLKIGLWFERHDLEGRSLTLERLPCAHHRAQRLLDLGVADAASDRDARLAVRAVGHVRLAADLLEVALAEPVGEPAEMIHVRMRQQDRR